MKKCCEAEKLNSALGIVAMSGLGFGRVRNASAGESQNSYGEGQSSPLIVLQCMTRNGDFFPMNTACYNDLYVISDLHMGGRSGFQIFQAGEELAGFLEYLVTLPLPKGHSQGLVINGDSVDFLAEDKAAYFAITDASHKLQRIMDDPAFKPVWKGLSKFLMAPGRELTILLGNHDIELALPEVKALLVERLAGNDLLNRARLRLCFDGTGFRCAVGSRDVLCLHGNESDAFNVVDFEQIRKLIRMMQRGHKPCEKDLPRLPGTRVVVDVMNELKASYRWVDLLKPEGAAAFPTLLALKPQYTRKLLELGDEGLDYFENQRKIDSGFLGALDVDKGTAAMRPNGADLLSAQLAKAFDESIAPASHVSEDLLLNELGDRLERGETTNPREAQLEGNLGAIDWIERTYNRVRAFLETKTTPQLLRLALKRFLESDATFGLTEKDGTFVATEKVICASIPFVVTGHTHLLRAIRRAAGGVYFNSGTWVQLMQIDPACLRDDSSFQPVYEALKKGGWTDIDHLMYRKPGIVRIWKLPGGGAAGQLLTWEGGSLVPISEMLS